MLMPKGAARSHFSLRRLAPSVEKAFLCFAFPLSSLTSRTAGANEARSTPRLLANSRTSGKPESVPEHFLHFRKAVVPRAAGECFGCFDAGKKKVAPECPAVYALELHSCEGLQQRGVSFQKKAIEFWIKIAAIRALAQVTPVEVVSQIQLNLTERD